MKLPGRPKDKGSKAPAPSRPMSMVRRQAAADKKKLKSKEELKTPGKNKGKTKTPKDKGVSKDLVLLKQTEALQKAAATFGVPSKRLFSLIADGQVDQAIIQGQRHMLSMILNLIPIAEQQYVKDKREHQAYALNSLISQARELAADIQGSGDRAQVAETIVTSLLNPTFQSFIQSLATEAQILRSSMGTKVKPEYKRDLEASIDAMLRQVALEGNELFRACSGSIRDLLGAPRKRGGRT